MVQDARYATTVVDFVFIRKMISNMVLFENFSCLCKCSATNLVFIPAILLEM